MFVFLSYMASSGPAKDPRKTKRTEKAVARMVFIDWDWVWGGGGGQMTITGSEERLPQGSLTLITPCL